MSGRRRVIDATLRIIADPAPAAYYACAVCPYTAEAHGRRNVTAFAASVRTDHRATCPTLHPERSTA